MISQERRRRRRRVLRKPSNQEKVWEGNEATVMESNLDPEWFSREMLGRAVAVKFKFNYRGERRGPGVSLSACSHVSQSQAEEYLQWRVWQEDCYQDFTLSSTLLCPITWYLHSASWTNDGVKNIFSKTKNDAERNVKSAKLDILPLLLGNLWDYNLLQKLTDITR